MRRAARTEIRGPRRAIYAPPMQTKLATKPHPNRPRLREPPPRLALPFLRQTPRPPMRRRPEPMHRATQTGKAVPSAGESGATRQRRPGPARASSLPPPGRAPSHEAKRVREDRIRMISRLASQAHASKARGNKVHATRARVNRILEARASHGAMASPGPAAKAIAAAAKGGTAGDSAPMPTEGATTGHTEAIAREEASTVNRALRGGTIGQEGFPSTIPCRPSASAFPAWRTRDSPAAA
jgi:hypothetical protein